jgi:hypothetical protein
MQRLGMRARACGTVGIIWDRLATELHPPSRSLALARSPLPLYLPSQHRPAAAELPPECKTRSFNQCNFIPRPSPGTHHRSIAARRRQEKSAFLQLGRTFAVPAAANSELYDGRSGAFETELLVTVRKQFREFRNLLLAQRWHAPCIQPCTYFFDKI